MLCMDLHRDCCTHLPCILKPVWVVKCVTETRIYYLYYYKGKIVWPFVYLVL